ncbi:MAG: carboxypeptidase-like regulatory domain-containing protein [Pyrinomonadaceae bacterium]
MSKVLAILLLVIATSSFAFAQESTRNSDDPPSTGVAPKVVNGVGRADVRVRDENGNPIKDAYVKLESTRTDGFFCESWNNTDERGLAGLPPLHMGSLKLKIKAKGYKSVELEIPADQLGEPVRVTLKKK